MRPLVCGPAGTVFSRFNVLRGFSRGMGRADAYFHAGFAGILVLGVVFIAPAADALWDSLNRGVRAPACPAAAAACTLLPEQGMLCRTKRTGTTPGSMCG